MQYTKHLVLYYCSFYSGCCVYFYLTAVSIWERPTLNQTYCQRQDGHDDYQPIQDEVAGLFGHTDVLLVSVGCKHIFVG